MISIKHASAVKQALKQLWFMQHRAFSVEMSAVNKEFNKRKLAIPLSFNIELKLSLAKEGHPLYFDNQATTPLDPR